VLPATQQRRHSRLYPNHNAGTRFSDREGCKAALTLCAHFHFCCTIWSSSINVADGQTDGCYAGSNLNDWFTFLMQSCPYEGIRSIAMSVMSERAYNIYTWAQYIAFACLQYHWILSLPAIYGLYTHWMGTENFVRLSTGSAVILADHTTSRLSPIEDRGPTDRVLNWDPNSNPNLDLRLWLQAHESYGYDPYTCERSRSKVTRFKS